MGLFDNSSSHAADSALSRITDGGSADERAWNTEDHEKLLCTVAAVVLIAILAGSALATEQMTTTFLDKLSTTRDAFVQISTHAGGALFPLTALPFIALFAATWARRGYPQTPPPAWLAPVRLTALAAAAMMTALCTAWLWLDDGRDGSVAEASGVTWYEDGRPVEQRAWSEATALKAACVMVEVRRRHGTAWVPSFRYEASFADGRHVELPRDEDMTHDWPRRIAPIDAALRAAGIPREGRIETQCLEETYRTSRADPETLRRVLAP